MICIREVDGADEDIADALTKLHRMTFDQRVGVPDFADGHWWIAYNKGGLPVAFAGVTASTEYPLTGYYERVGVTPTHRGQGLQLRLTRALELRCRRNGWCAIVSDTRDNIPSANNFIRAGYRLFDPPQRWAFVDSLYWIKEI